ncbi:MAG: HSP90 family protein [Oscillospiraceae bacterium]|nr:HSP90 family protein [Oscillospiraceae bacterium]
MSEYLFSVNLGGMIDILSNHLYSSPKVFLRELLQNAADAVSLRRKNDPSFSEPQIDIIVEEKKSLLFRDNGNGLTEEEIHKFISVIGQSSKRGENSSFIGRFGIGLLSCFIVTDEIILRSRSAKTPDKVYEWHGFSDGKYSVTEVNGDMPVGTEIFIKTDEKHEQLFTSDEVIKNIRYYGLPLPYPVYVSSGEGIKLRANILFSKNGDDERQNILEMGRNIFGSSCDYLDYIPLTSKKGLFSGLAFILPYTVSAAAKSKHRIYLKNMLLTEDGSSVLPEWAFFVQCFFDTDKLSPTASREDFYHDAVLEEAKEEISTCIEDYLERLSIQNPLLLAKIVALHGVALKSIAAENERLFRIFMPYFNFETSFGTLGGKELMQYGSGIFFTSNIDVFRQLRPVFAEKKELLVNTGYVHEKALLNMLATLEPVHIEPLSDDLLENLLEEPEDEKSFSFMSDIFNSELYPYECRAVLRSFSPEQVAAIYSINSEAELKRDIKNAKENSDDLFMSMLNAFEEELDNTAEAVLYLNSRNPLIKKLAENADDEKLAVYAKIIYVQSLISGGFPIRKNELTVMNDSLIQLMEWGI